MRIAVLMASAGSRLGGLETIAREFSAGLTLLGHDVTLVTGRGPGARMLREVQNAPYRVVTAPMFGQTSFPARLVGRLRGVHPSVVESRLFWNAAIRTPRTQRALESSRVVSAHFEPEAVLASRALCAPVVYFYAGAMDARRLARGRFRRVVAISGTVKSYHEALKVPGLPPVSAVVLPGVRGAAIASGPAPGVASDQPEVIFTGRLDDPAEKGVERLIAWWPHIAREAPGARLTIVGGGLELPRLRQEVAERGLQTTVTLTGPLSRDQVQQRLSRAGLYVFPSEFETFGVAPLEALAAGLPVVASDIPALRESLGFAAILLPLDDEAAWKQTIVRLLNDAPERNTWAEKGPARARQLTWSMQSKAYEVQLLEAAGESP